MKFSPASIFKIALAAVLLGAAVRGALPDPRFTVTVLDVGQGDAILAQCGTHQVLIDGGPDGSVLSRLGRVTPFFDRTIDAVVLTHPHADHFLGLIPVLGRYRVGGVFTSGMTAKNAEYLAFTDAAAQAGATPTPLTIGDRLPVGDCGWLTVLWNDPAPASGDPNDASVVLRAAANNAGPRAAVLLTGDATQAVEAAMLRRTDPALLAADGLKAGHHGSNTSSSTPFLQAVHPSFIAVSVAAKNTYHLPSPPALERLAATGAHIFRTDQDGDIRFVLTVEGVTAAPLGK